MGSASLPWLHAYLVLLVPPKKKKVFILCLSLTGFSLKYFSSLYMYCGASLMLNRFTLYAGTAGAENVALESRVNPGSAALKAKLIPIFCRSITAANTFPAALQCIFGCIYGKHYIHFSCILF